MNRDEPQRDPSGKIADEYSTPHLMRTFCFKNDAGVREAVFALTLKIFEDISGSRLKRLRERSIPVWWGTATAYGVEYLIVGLKYDPSFEVVTAFSNRFDGHPSYSEMTSTDAESFLAAPYLRYEAGLVVLYAGPFENHAHWKLPLDFRLRYELRSFRRKPSTTRSPFTRPEPPTHKSASLHSESVWRVNQHHILKFVHNLKGPCGYRRLKSILVDSFGMHVHEEGGKDFKQFGLIKLNLIDTESDELSARVEILINAHLDESLKYFVLCHELSHYVLHFRLLMLANLINRASWEIPEIGPYFSGILLQNNASILTALEDDADRLAANLVVPPWFMLSAERVTAMIMEAGQSPRPEEMIWRFLQPLFPEDKFSKLSWKNFMEMKTKARKDQLRVMNLAPDSSDGLFERVFRAALGSYQRARDGKEQIAAANDLELIIDQAISLLNKINSLEAAAARQYMATLLPKLSVHTPDSLPQDIALSNTGFRRQVIPPVDWDGQSLYPVIPLIPASYNVSDSGSEDWILFEGPRVSGFVREWQDWKRDHGLLLIGRETWKREQMKKNMRS